MSETTSILDLPTDPVGGISITAQETIQSQTQTQSQTPQVAIDQNIINQIVSGLQQATLSGATKLPSRDIPMNTSNITIDQEVMPNYVPSSSQDYITNYEKTTDIINNYNKNRQTNDSLDDMYNEIQMPLLLAVLYFLFQLPFFKKALYNYIPFLFSNDGNYNINGYLFTSVLFGVLFHFLMKIVSYFGTF